MPLVATALDRGARAQQPPPGDSADFDVVEKDIADLQAALRDGTVTSRRLVELYWARIDADNRTERPLNAFIALNPGALAQAAALDRERQAGRARGPLHGIPLAIKDNVFVEGLPVTAGTLALDGFVAPGDAFQMKRLRDRGVIVIGKTNLHELAAGITTVSSAGGQTRNPYDRTRNPGGSSGGTAAAIAASLAPAGIGTDTCGSVRIPAAHNALWGLRPTFGLSSRGGIIPLSHSQDVAGPLARSVADLAILLDATVGVDPDDPSTEAGRNEVPSSYMGFMGDSSLVNVRIGVVTSLFGTAREDEEVRHVVSGALDTLAGMGAGVSDVDIDLEALLRDTSSILPEFKFDLMDFLERYRAPVRSLDEILRWGLYRTELDQTFRDRNAVESRDSDAYRTVRARRAAATASVLGTMRTRGLTLLAYPTLRRKAAVIGEPQIGSNCQLSATTGLPALSMPAGFTEDGLPVGLELLGPAFSEGTLLRVAYAYERVAHPRRPPPAERSSTPAPR